jgi:predicted metalloprotease
VTQDDEVPARPPWWFRRIFFFLRSAPPLTRTQWSLLGLLGLTLQINHYDFALLSLALPQIQAGLGVPEERLGGVMASVRLGVVPAILLAFLADRVGRRRLLIATILGFTESVWEEQFRRKGKTYQHPKLVLYSGGVESACGMSGAATGPFYCPADYKLYIDLSFYDELREKFQAPGDFAMAYVIAHEVGHHVQTLLGTSERVQQAQQRARSQTDANRYSVALELQADCFGGVWAAHASEASNGKIALDPGDLAEGLKAASAVGDDTLQRQTRGRVMPESFTHGSAAQRQTWLRRGYDSGDPAECDTLSGLR